MLRWILLAGVSLLTADATVAIGGAPQCVVVDDEQPSPLDVILRRLDSIERRLSALEAQVLDQHPGLVGEYWIDDAGVMRLQSGRPIGFWGIDAPRPAINEQR